MDELELLERDLEALRACRATAAAATTASGEQALRVVAMAAHVRHLSDSITAPYAARLDQLSDPSLPTRFARWKGFPNAGALMSSVTGLSVGEANKLIAIGKALLERPDAELGLAEPPTFTVVPGAPESELREDGLEVGLLESPTGETFGAPVLVPALELGDEPVALPVPYASPLAAGIRDASLGTDKANVIRRTLEDMLIDTRETERFLVEKAEELDLVQLRRLCLTVLAERDPEGHAAREARQNRARFLRFYEDPDGMITVYGKLPPVYAASAKAWFEAEMQAQVFAQRDWRPEEQRSLGQILADVFVTTTRHAAGCDRATSRPKSTFIVRVSQETLQNGKGYASCDGIEAPLTLAAALSLAVDVEIAAMLVGENEEPLNMGRSKRHATKAQRRALAQRDKGCAMCSAAISRCDAHHIIEWNKGGVTNLDNLVMLCIGCHHRIHDFGWGIVVERNQVWFIPPASHDPLRRRQPGSSVTLAA